MVCDSSVLRRVTNVSAPSGVLNFGNNQILEEDRCTNLSDTVNVRDFGPANLEKQRQS